MTDANTAEAIGSPADTFVRTGRGADPIEVGDQIVKALVVKGSDGRGYSWNLGRTFDAAQAGFGYINDTLSGVIVGEGSYGQPGWYICFVADCAFPSYYLIQAESPEEALEVFEDECKACLLDDACIKDLETEQLAAIAAGRGDSWEAADARINSSGKWVTTQTQYIALEEITLICDAKGKH